jgi:hypothetical protein
MADLKIRMLKGRGSAPETTVTVPGTVLKIASKLVPKRAVEALQERGLALEEIIKLAENPEARGTLVEVEDEEERANRHRAGVANARSGEPAAPRVAVCTTPWTAPARRAWRRRNGPGGRRSGGSESRFPTNNLRVLGAWRESSQTQSVCLPTVLPIDTPGTAQYVRRRNGNGYGRAVRR